MRNEVKPQLMKLTSHWKAERLIFIVAITKRQTLFQCQTSHILVIQGLNAHFGLQYLLGQLKLFMIVDHIQTNNSLSPKRFYIKRKQYKEEDSFPNGSIFEASQSRQMDSISFVEELKKYQTLTTAIDNTITLNNQETFSTMEKSSRQGREKFLPKLNLALQAKIARSNLQIKSQALKVKPKAFSYHDSDPLYMKLEKTISKRVNNKFNNYKQGWKEYCLRRKEKSVIERSFDRAAKSIEQINFDAKQRKNTTQLSEMLRNNIAEKTFVFPGKLKPQIQGLKGKGGKVVPIFSEIFMVQQVFKHNKAKPCTIS